LEDAVAYADISRAMEAAMLTGGKSPPFYPGAEGHIGRITSRRAY
jgi:hypothetical protein